MGRVIRSAAIVSTAANGRMMKTVFACKVIAAACLVAATGSMAAAAAERLPRSFHGTWASDLAQCAETGGYEGQGSFGEDQVVLLSRHESEGIDLSTVCQYDQIRN